MCSVFLSSLLAEFLRNGSIEERAERAPPPTRRSAAQRSGPAAAGTGVGASWAPGPINKGRLFLGRGVVPNDSPRRSVAGKRKLLPETLGRRFGRISGEGFGGTRAGRLLFYTCSATTTGRAARSGASPGFLIWRHAGQARVLGPLPEGCLLGAFRPCAEDHRSCRRLTSPPSRFRNVCTCFGAAFTDAERGERRAFVLPDKGRFSSAYLFRRLSGAPIPAPL